MDRATRQRELAKATQEYQDAYRAWDSEVASLRNLPPTQFVDTAWLDHLDQLRALRDEKERRWLELLAEPPT